MYNGRNQTSLTPPVMHSGQRLTGLHFVAPVVVMLGTGEDNLLAQMVNVNVAPVEYCHPVGTFVEAC